MVELSFRAPVQVSQHGKGQYHFLQLPCEVGELLDDLPFARKGFKSIKCEAKIGDTAWVTSVFPDGDSFLLLLAKKRLEAEGVVAGDTVEVGLTVRQDL